MRRRDIILDFTSLLDVVLIILFFFILFSHMEIEDNKELVEMQMAEVQAMADEADKKMTEAEDLIEQLHNEIETVQKSNVRRAANTKAMLEFGRSQNLKMILHAKAKPWELVVSAGDEILAKMPAGSDIGTEIVNVLTDAGYTAKDTLFCEFILNGNEGGTHAAYPVITEAIKFVKNTYPNLYYSETDIAIVEEQP